MIGWMCGLMADLRVGDLVDCRRCGGLMMVSERREDLCGRCGREVFRNEGPGDSGAVIGRRYDGGRRARDGAARCRVSAGCVRHWGEAAARYGECDPGGAAGR